MKCLLILSYLTLFIPWIVSLVVIIANGAILHFASFSSLPRSVEMTRGVSSLKVSKGPRIGPGPVPSGLSLVGDIDNHSRVAQSES